MLKVKIFEEECEQELEDRINRFLGTIKEHQLRDIKYNVEVAEDFDEDDDETTSFIYSFSALILYES
jgi:hypothetical protein